MSIGLEEVRVNDHVKIIDKARISSKDLNMQAFVEEVGDSLGEDRTRIGIPTFRRGVVTNLIEGGAFLVIQTEIGKLVGTKIRKGRDKGHTYEDLRHQNSRTGPYSNLHLHRIGVSGLLSTIVGLRTPRKLKYWSGGEVVRVDKSALGNFCICSMLRGQDKGGMSEKEVIRGDFIEGAMKTCTHLEGH